MLYLAVPGGRQHGAAPGGVHHLFVAFLRDNGPAPQGARAWSVLVCPAGLYIWRVRGAAKRGLLVGCCLP
jgi:hypothetical protein